MAIKLQCLLDKKLRQEERRLAQQLPMAKPISTKSRGHYECPLTYRDEAQLAHTFRMRCVSKFEQGIHPVVAIQEAAREVRGTGEWSASNVTRHCAGEKDNNMGNAEKEGRIFTKVYFLASAILAGSVFGGCFPQYFRAIELFFATSCCLLVLSLFFWLGAWGERTDSEKE